MQLESRISHNKNDSIKKVSQDGVSEYELKVSENTPTTSHGHFNTPLEVSDNEEGLSNIFQNEHKTLRQQNSKFSRSTEKKDLATLSHAA